MKTILAAVEASLESDLQFLETMVNMESPSDDKALVDCFARFVGEEFARIGGRVTLVPAEGFGDHLRIDFPGAGSERLLLLGHTDTVFPAGEAKRRPFQREGNRATGPGVFDMKGGILIMWQAIRALREVRGGLPRPVTVLLSSDEEVGSKTSRTLIEGTALESKAVLVFEPSLPGGTLKTSRKGVGRFVVKTIGRAAHAGIDPEKGVNAIEEAAHHILALQRLTDFSKGTTVTVGVIQGGTRSNVVPAETTIEVDVRVKSMDEASRITQAIEGFRPVLRDARIEIRGGVSRPPMERTPATVKLFEVARAVANDLGRRLDEGSTGGGSDGNLTSALGVPTLDGLGAVGDGAHAVHEYIEVDHLPWRAALIAGLIERI